MMTKMLESGQVLAARYALLRKIGSGRTGEVWQARDRLTQADVALKLLAADAAAVPARRAQFLRAAALQREFEHPRILRCFDILDEGPRPMVACALAGGGDVSRLRGRPWREVHPVLLDVAEALRALHARGLVHRDVKPANVLLDDSGRGLLTDFELALPLGALDAERAASPQSSSPQQRRGDAAAIADDLYGFGALACELCTGYAPGIAVADAAGYVLPPRAQVPDAAAALIRECLADEPAQRPRNIDAVLERLGVPEASTPQAAAAVQPISLQAPSAAAEPLNPQWQRVTAAPVTAAQLRRQGFRRGLLMAGFAVLLIAVAGVFLVLPRWVEQRRPVVAVTPEAPPPAAPAAAPTVQERNLQQLAEARRLAEELKPAVSARLAALERRNAGSWAGPQFASGKIAYSDFERLTGERDYAAALQRLKSADTDLLAVEKSAVGLLSAALGAGNAALGKGDIAEARLRYELAARIDPANAAAKRGLARAAVWDQVRTVLEEAGRHEGEGNTAAALGAYRRALALDPDTAPAREAIARIGARAGDEAYAAAIARAFSATARKDFAAARAAFSEAERLRPGSAEVRDGRAQIDRALGDAVLTGHLARAAAAEQAERWQEALGEYRKALAADANLLAAQQGVERAEPRAQLEAELASYLSRPERLFSSEVRAAARAAVRNAGQIAAPGAALNEQAARLTSLITAAETPVHIGLASDNQTRVTIYRVGELGAFERRDMDLMPGRYTVVGTRQGYRDVRRELTVLPGRETGTIDIRCEEPI